MGIPMSVDVPAPADPRRAERAVRTAFARLHEADRRFSRFRSESEVSRFGAGDLRPEDLSADLTEVLALATRAGLASGGAFTVRRPDGTLDTDGVVKGWAAQRAAGVLDAAGVGAFCLNAGGDVVTRGEPVPGRGWRVGVRDPSDAHRFLVVVEQRDGAVATSGTYERGAHVWDGRTGRAASGLLSATVLAADLTTADVLATCVLALGRDGVAWAAGQGATAVLAVDDDGRVVGDTAGLRLLDGAPAV
ncbi:FAD:protein FMN transferase [Cellulomonas chitinilytica]|nr:FAD:protein FMN transferase [Cellulomonas chitinilytica]